LILYYTHRDGLTPPLPSRKTDHATLACTFALQHRSQVCIARLRILPATCQVASKKTRKSSAFTPACAADATHSTPPLTLQRNIGALGLRSCAWSMASFFLPIVNAQQPRAPPAQPRFLSSPRPSPPPRSPSSSTTPGCGSVQHLGKGEPLEDLGDLVVAAGRRVVVPVGQRVEPPRSLELLALGRVWHTSAEGLDSIPCASTAASVCAIDRWRCLAPRSTRKQWKQGGGKQEAQNHVQARPRGKLCEDGIEGGGGSGQEEDGKWSECLFQRKTFRGGAAHNT
jgi:hypothetical protein